MTTKINDTEVSYEPWDEDYRKTCVAVRVYSRKRTKPQLQAGQQIDITDLGNAQAVFKMVSATAGAAAEYLGEHYGDNIDPSDCARDAGKALSEESKLMAAVRTPDLAIKLARVSGFAAKLSAADRELLSRIEWRHRNGLTTPAEVFKVDNWIALIHSQQL